MKKLTVWTVLMVLVILGSLTSCSSSSLPTQLPETMKSACTLYQQVRPDVVKLRQYAKDNWAAIPPSVQETLLKLDSYLPELDRAGILVCGASTISPAPQARIQWDDVLATVVKAATLAADLKKQGVI